MIDLKKDRFYGVPAIQDFVPIIQNSYTEQTFIDNTNTYKENNHNKTSNNLSLIRTKSNKSDQEADLDNISSKVS